MYMVEQIAAVYLLFWMAVMYVYLLFWITIQ